MSISNYIYTYFPFPTFYSTVELFLMHALQHFALSTICNIFHIILIHIGCLLEKYICSFCTGNFFYKFLSNIWRTLKQYSSQIFHICLIRFRSGHRAGHSVSWISTSFEKRRTYRATYIHALCYHSQSLRIWYNMLL